MDNLFRTSFVVRIGDINYAGHMGNDRFLTLFQDARIRFLASIGCAETDIGGGIGFVMAEAHVKFLKEVFLGDKLVVELTFRDFRKTGFTVDHRVGRGQDEVATGYTVLVSFDYGKRRVARLPGSFVRKLSGE